MLGHSNFIKILRQTMRAYTDSFRGDDLGIPLSHERKRNARSGF